MWSPGSVAGPSERGRGSRSQAISGSPRCRREHAERARDLPPQVRIARRRQIIQDCERLVPLSVENETPEPGEAGRDARAESSSGPAQRRLCLSRELSPRGGIGRAVGHRHVVQLVEQGERDREVVIELREELASLRPRPSRLVRPAQRRVSDAESVVRECGDWSGFPPQFPARRREQRCIARR